MFKYFEKINGNYLSFACLSNKISFLSYSIFNLLLPELQLRTASKAYLSLTACILYHIGKRMSNILKHFFKLFLKIFKLFLKFQKTCAFLDFQGTIKNHRQFIHKGNVYIPLTVFNHLNCFRSFNVRHGICSYLNHKIINLFDNL